MYAGVQGTPPVCKKSAMSWKRVVMMNANPMTWHDEYGIVTKAVSPYYT